MALLYWFYALPVGIFCTVAFKRLLREGRARSWLLRLTWIAVVAAPFWDVIPGKIALHRACATRGGVQVFVPPGQYSGVTDARLTAYYGGGTTPDLFGIQEASDVYTDKVSGQVIAKITGIYQYTGDLGFVEPWMEGGCFRDSVATTKTINQLLQGVKQ